MANVADPARVSRRAALRWLAVGTSMALLAACGPATPGAGPATAVAPAQPTTPTQSPSSTGAPAGAATPASSGAPRQGGTLRVGQIGDLPSLDGHNLGYVLAHIWDRPVDYDITGVPQPMLAESWDVNDDTTQHTFHLRKSVMWHTGREMTSEDWRWNLERALDDPGIEVEATRT
jgi:ABC-type transport system substrate-binding protein